jgi:hypothetical protein
MSEWEKRNKKRIHSGQTLNPFIQKQLQFQAKVDNAYAWGSTFLMADKVQTLICGVYCQSNLFRLVHLENQIQSGRSAAPKTRLKQSCKLSKVCLFRE